MTNQAMSYEEEIKGIRDEKAWTDMTAQVNYLKGCVKAKNFWVSCWIDNNNDDSNRKH